VWVKALIPMILPESRSISIPPINPIIIAVVGCSNRDIHKIADRIKFGYIPITGRYPEKAN